MSPTELGLCVSALTCSSVSQLFMKGSVISCARIQRLFRLGMAGILQLFSIGLAVLALRTLSLSQIVPFAAGAYLLVPLGSRHLYGERLDPSFWVGALFIFFGILLTQL
jgi:drug/metabolite transporter (DMT)-like permease